MASMRTWPAALRRRRRALSWPATIGLLLLGGALLCVLDATVIEPRWIKLVRLRLNDHPRHRLAFITDIHYLGDPAQLQRAVRKLNQLKPECVLVGGDLTEKASRTPGALQLLSTLNCPVYMVPGNHDWSEANLAVIETALRAHGGDLLQDETVELGGGDFTLTGASGWPARLPPVPPRKPGCTRLFMVHFPAFVNLLRDRPYDLTLAGHSHGGQVRIPFYGAILLPDNLDGYDKGYFPDTPAGPLYVNPGLGYWYMNLRFCCRPEITLVEF